MTDDQWPSASASASEPTPIATPQNPFADLPQPVWDILEKSGDMNGIENRDLPNP